MAKQDGILPVKGSIDNITFYKSQDGYLARKKGGISAERIATDAAFVRTRENGAEFGRAGLAGKLLRTSLRSLVQSASDSRMVSRLTSAFVKVIQADATSVRGKRNVIDGESELLKGFDFNKLGKLNSSFYAPFSTTINRPTGDLTVTIPAFIPNHMIAAPGGATHYKLVAGGSSVDFEGGSYTAGTAETAVAPIDNNLSPIITLSTNIGPASTVPIFLTLGIQFFQELNGDVYQLKNGSFNALSIVDVSGL